MARPQIFICFWGNVSSSECMARLPDWKTLVEAEKKPRRWFRWLLEGDGLDPGYLHWEALRKLDPPPKLTSEAWWALIKLQRAQRRQRLSLPGGPWSYGHTPWIHRLTDQLLFDAAAFPGLEEPRFRVSALTEEAIHSCRLDGLAVEEGHPTKLAVRSKQPPKEVSARAAWNLFHFLNGETRSVDRRPLDAAFLAGVAEHLTVGTEDEGSWPGIEDGDLARLSGFLEGGEAESYVPPLVRVAGAYAWLRSELEDWAAGGRFARALFVWGAAHLQMPLIAALAWSPILSKTPKKARRALRQTLSDEHDLNYFLIHHLKTLQQAQERRERRVQKKGLEAAEVPWLQAQELAGINPRQRALTVCAWHHPHTVFTIALHQEAHGIVYETARTDLATLAKRGFLERAKRQRAFVYQLGDRWKARAVDEEGPLG